MTFKNTSATLSDNFVISPALSVNLIALTLLGVSKYNLAVL